MSAHSRHGLDWRTVLEEIEAHEGRLSVKDLEYADPVAIG